MKAYNLINRYGHLYDTLTRKRVSFKDNTEVIVLTDAVPEEFKPAGVWPLRILDEKAQVEVLKSKGLMPMIDAVVGYRKVLNRNSTLFFTIDHHEFEVELLEDLYIYRKADWKSEKAGLFDCACAVRRCATGSIDYCEEIFATSLSELYKITYVHFFGNEGNPGTNAFETFYKIRGQEKSTIESVRSIVFL